MSKATVVVRLLSAVVLAASGLLAFNSSAQSCSTTPPIKYVGWVKAANVNFFIDTTYTDPQGHVTTMTLDQQTAIAAAFDNWTNGNNASTGGNNSHVTYSIVFDRSQAQFTVHWGDPHGPLGTELAGTTTFRDAAGYYTVGADAVIRPDVTNPTELTQVMAHEIGHPAGFGDCDACAPGSSVMKSTCCYSNSPTGPTACDNSTLMQNNYPPCNAPAFSCSGYDPNTCSCNALASGGGGVESDGVYNREAPCVDWYVVTYVSINGGPWHAVSVEYAGCW